MKTASAISSQVRFPEVALQRATMPAFVRKLLSSKSTVFGLAIIGIVLVAAIIGPVVAQVDPAHQELALRRAGFSPDHPFGMDEFGRDVLSRMLHGGRFTLMAGVLSVSIALAGGVPLGLCSGPPASPSFLSVRARVMPIGHPASLLDRLDPRIG